MLLYTALKNKMGVEEISAISKEYVFYLNTKFINDYLCDKLMDIQHKDIVCLASFLFDDTFLRLYTLIKTENTDDAIQRKIKHILSYSEEKKSVELLKKITPKGFLLVPAGKFIFGSNNSLDEKYNKLVWLPSYYISKYPVTEVVYEKDDLSLLDDSASAPCHGMTWYSAYEFAKRHCVSLPTEAQWEKASRGIDGRQYPWGNNFVSDYVNSFESGINHFTTVGFYENIGKSPYGVVDSVGNCWEWTCSIYDKYDTESFLKGVDDTVKGDRVLRGGAFDFDLYGVTCTNRYRCNPGNGWDTHGFRVVINL